MQDVGGTRKNYVNHEPEASELKAFLVFFQHLKCVITLVIRRGVQSLASMK